MDLHHQKSREGVRLGSKTRMTTGPLHGVRVLEFAALGPVPWAAMMLSDMGADVLRVDRAGATDLGVVRQKKFQFIERGRRSVTADLKTPEGLAGVKALAARADILLEGFRPGVMERNGLSPDVCLDLNPQLVYGRMTGWGQTGPMAQVAGHDINYIATIGALHAIGPSDGGPAVPLNLIGDFGGGGMLLLAGVLAALHAARGGYGGQVVDAAMVDGTALLMASTFGRFAAGEWTDDRQNNVLDGGAPFYGTYRTKDDKYIAIGAVEPKFYHAMLSVLGLDPAALPAQYNQSSWPAMRKRLSDIFATRTRDDWCKKFEGVEACFAPVLSLSEIYSFAHHVERKSFVDVDGIQHPAPSPRFSATPTRIASPPTEPGTLGDAALQDWGFVLDDTRLEGLSWTGRKPK